MANRDIIVIGSSAGGVQACYSLLTALPPDLPAALFIVQHTREGSLVADVFARCSSLHVKAAIDGEAIADSRVYVAPGGQHLMINDGQIQLSKAPRENYNRPSVNVLFRSAARAGHSRVIAVILTGVLDDGASGAIAVKARGGLVIVQDPRDAEFPDMPQNRWR